MKTFRIILVSFLFITACQLQQVRKHDGMQERSDLVADFPEGISKNASGYQLLSANPAFPISHNNPKSVTDTIIKKKESKDLLKLRNQDKRIVVPVTDAVSEKLISRSIPGIEWIEQKVDNRTILKIHFENDLITYSNTDRYFTNGIRFDLQAAWLAGSTLQKLMIPYRHKSYATYNLSMVQNMYTPTDTRVAPELSRDRPYSSVLYFEFRRKVADLQNNLILSTEFDLGYIGPYSLGSSLQTMVHKTFPTNDKPQGWETQINSDIILNYSVQAQKALVNSKNLTLLAGLNAEAGTLYTNAGAGLQMQAGKAEPIFGLDENQQWPELEYFFFAKTDISFVAYNALLQGGMFNHDNVFTLKQNEIEHLVGNAEAGIHFMYKGIGMEIAQHFISPEYKSGLWHKWGRMSLIFKL